MLQSVMEFCNLTTTPSQPGEHIHGHLGQTTPGITVNPSTTSSYTVTYTLGGCTPSTASGTVTVTPAPPVSVLNDSICDGDTSILTALQAKLVALIYGQMVLPLNQ